MQKLFSLSEKLFFNILFICLASFIYFIFLPMNETTISIGMIFCVLYFGMNFYTGYKYNLKITESIIVAIIGCGVGLFLSVFALYAQLILHSPNIATWITMPYYIPTLSLAKLFSINITLAYTFYLMIINILLVIIGACSRNIMNKFFSIYK